MRALVGALVVGVVAAAIADAPLPRLNTTGDPWGWASPTHIQDVLRPGGAAAPEFDGCPFAAGDELGPGYTAHVKAMQTPTEKAAPAADYDAYRARRRGNSSAADEYCLHGSECYDVASERYRAMLPGTTFETYDYTDEDAVGAHFGLRPKDVAAYKAMLQLDSTGVYRRESTRHPSQENTDWIRKLGLWRAHGITMGDGSNYDDLRETPPHINALARQAVEMSTGTFVAGAGRNPSATTCFKVNVTELMAGAVGVTETEILRAYSVAEKMNLARGHAATVAWSWMGRRFQSRSQRADAPHAMDAAWADHAASADATNGYPPGGVTWSRDGRKVGPPYAEADATARGGQAYAYGMLAWDIATGISVWGASEYADGDVTVGRVAEQSAYANETRYLRSEMTLEEGVAVDGGFMRDNVFPAEPPTPTVEDARAIVGKTIVVPPPWYTFGLKKPAKSYNATLVDAVLGDLWGAFDAHANLTRNLYRRHMAAVANPAAWAVVQTCRQDVPAPAACWNRVNPGTQTPTAHAEAFGVTCVSPDERFVFPECERDETVRMTATRVVYDRRVGSFKEYFAATRGPSPKYDRTCHYSHAVCTRGVKAKGYTWVSNTCDTGKSPSGFGPSCRRPHANRGGPVGDRANLLMDVVGGWTEPMTATPMCVLGYGGPGCQRRCGNVYDPDQVGRKKHFPHQPCHLVKWDTCASVDPPSGCELDFDCLYNDASVQVPPDRYWAHTALTLFELDPDSAAHAAAIEAAGADAGAPGWTRTPEGTYVYSSPLSGRFSSSAATAEALAATSSVDEVLDNARALNPNSPSLPASFKPRNRGCSRHGLCFAPGHEDACLCAANVGGEFCTQCADGFYGYDRVQPVFSNPHDPDGGCAATDTRHPAWTPEFVARETCARWKGGFLGADPLSTAARDDPALVARETLDSFAVPVRTDGVAGRRRLEEAPDLAPDLAALRDLFTQPGAGPVLKPPVVDGLGCGGSCWGYRPEDGLTDNEVWSRSVDAWDPDASAGVYNLTDSCGVNATGGIAYAGATETWEELYARCDLLRVTDAAVWVQVVASCPATPDAEERRTLSDVCNIGDTSCAAVPVSQATAAIGLTPQALFGCPADFAQVEAAVADGAAAVWGDPVDGLDGVDAAQCRTPLDLGEIAVPGGWHTADLPCTDADPQCVATLPDGGAAALDADGAVVLNDTERVVLLDAAARAVINTPAPCVECAPLHAAVLSQGALGNARFNADSVWGGCGAACDPAVFFATNPIRIPAVEAVRAEAGDAAAEQAMRMTGLTPATAMGCPLW